MIAFLVLLAEYDYGVMSSQSILSLYEPTADFSVLIVALLSFATEYDKLTTGLAVARVGL